MTLRAIFYDTETTGVRAEKDFIIEIAAYVPETGEVFDQLINPGVPIPPEATRIHNITDEMVKDAPTFPEIAAKFTEFCTSDGVLIAHNNDGFDVHFLRSEYQRAGLTLPEWKFVDTLKWARKYRPDLPRHALQFLREVYGIEANNAHRALDDVKVLHDVFRQMIGDLPFDTVIELLSEQKALQGMPFGKYQGKPLEAVPDSYVAWLAKSGAFERPENGQLKEAFIELGKLKEEACAT